MKEQKRIPVLIDTDLGDDVDDAAAFIMVMNSPELELKGITTVYKDTVKRAEMIRDLLRKKGFEHVPVYPGAGKAMIEPTVIEPPLQYELLGKESQEGRKTVHVKNAEAAQFIIDQVRENEDLVIIELGMMTNLALAFLMDPDSMKKAKIVGMGGEFKDSLPEWNILCDPEAARIVIDQAGYLVLFGLDITKYSGVSNEDMDRMCRTEVTKYFYEGVKIFQEKTGYPITLHDAVPVAWLICPAVSYTHLTLPTIA